MDTLISKPSWLRRWRVVSILGLILLVSSVLAYCVRWTEPSRDVCFVPIRVAAYDVRPLAHLGQPTCAFALPGSLDFGSARQDIERALDTLANRGQQPVVVCVTALARRGETGQIVLLPSDASPDDAATWLPLRDVLAKLQACPSRHKLLVLDLTPAPVALGNLYHDLAAALPHELDAVPDDHRLVLCAASPGQTSHWSGELGQSVFGHYFQEALRGDADRRVTVKALAAFVQARVERWTWHNRGEKQTPMLLGAGRSFTLAAVDAEANLPAKRSYPAWLLNAWRARDSAYQSGQYRLTPRLFQQHQATLLALEQAWCAGHPEATLRKRWLAECERLQDTMRRMSNNLVAIPNPLGPTADIARTHLGEGSEILLRCSASAEKALRVQPSVPGFVSLLEEPASTHHAGELRFLSRGYTHFDEARARLATANRQFDRLTALDERWRQCEKLLDEALAELPWYVEAIEALPELRTPWEQATVAARGLAEALKATADPQKPWDARVDRLTALVAEAEKHAGVLKQQRQHLHAPFSRDALAKLRRQCRAPLADAAPRHIVTALLSVAAPVLTAEDRAGLWQACQVLARRLNDQTLAQDCQDNATPPSSPVSAPPTENEPRRAQLRARWQIALLELAGVSDSALHTAHQRLGRCNEDANNPVAWCKLGAALRRLRREQMPQQYRHEPSWRERERLAWLMPRLERFADIDDAASSPTVEHRRRDRDRLEQWQQEQRRYLARDYHGVNCESPGIAAARDYYARAAGNDPASKALEPAVRVNVARSIEPLTAKRPCADVVLEVTSDPPAAASEPIELRIHCADDAWLEIAPASVSLPALLDSTKPRARTHQVPLKVSLKPDAERSGSPPPLGFLVEARLGGRCYHHLVTTPIVPNAQEVQILVSSDPNAPTVTVNDLRLRPGKVRQPHYVYVRNLTNRARVVHVEIRAGATLVYQSGQPLPVEPDAIAKVDFDEPDVKLTELTGPLTVRVLDENRQKVLHERLLGTAILAPQDYIKLTDVSYEPGLHGQSKWTIQVQAMRAINGPAIAAQLVLPMQHIPGLIGVGGGTLQVEVPAHQTTSRTLFAEGIRLVRGTEEEGPVYVTIDGVPRAFVYRTAFSRSGAASQPRPDDRPAVRLLAPPCVMAGINLLVDVEVDNAPKGAKLEIMMGRRLADGSFRVESIRHFTDAKKRRIDLEASNGALTFEASISDWTANFDTRSLTGACTLEAKLLDVGGAVLASCRQPLVLDDSPPLARFTPTVAAVKKGSVLHVQAQGLDPESGVAEVCFFFGREQRGEIPQGVRRFRAIPASRDQSMWTAALLIPADQKGPLAVSVYVLNQAGLASIDTITLEVTD